MGHGYAFKKRQLSETVARRIRTLINRAPSANATACPVRGSSRGATSLCPSFSGHAQCESVAIHMYMKTFNIPTVMSSRCRASVFTYTHVRKNEASVYNSGEA